ncbi:GNAT family N-acetyltransferase [Methanobrevibacter sp.]|uniref:GNAT family N-acetyltransferase n=1 Tax=Methanobrevibacter sp. TaxID=66852 RepID=UPI0038705E06
MELIKLQDKDLAKFKSLMQESFQYGYEIVYGECEELILPEKDIDECLNKENSQAYAMKNNEDIVGGVIIEINEKTQHNHLDFLFVSVSSQNKGIGQKIWSEIESLYPNTKIWETCTPYFDKRNIHFYVNRLGFHIVEFLNEKNPEPDFDKNHPMGDEEMFRFEKIMKG